MNEQDRLVLTQRAIEALKARIAADSYVDIRGVMARLGYSRAIIEAIPMEILPYVPFGRGSRVYRRYHPADVAACDARLRAWERAKQRGQGTAYLERLGAELAAQDQATIRVAVESRQAVA
jgi:hypothetical protein